MTLSEAQLTQIRRQLLEDDARTLVEAMKQMGVEKAEALHLIEELW